jgi:hypothetical protein
VTAARNVFDATREVGARASASPAGRLPYRCIANDCPMPGTIFDSGAADGICAWHYGAMPSRWPTITQILNADWACVTVHYCAVRRVLASTSTCMDGMAHVAVLDGGRDLVGIAPGWGLGPCAGEDIGEWGRRLGHFLHGCVMGKPQAQHNAYARGTPATAPTPEKQWAYNTVASHAAGALISTGALRMALEVVGAAASRPTGAVLPADVSATPPPAPNPYASFLAESEEEF